MTGRASSSANFLSISHTSCWRFCWLDSIDCQSTSLSTSGFAVAGIITLRTAHIVLVELRVRIVDPGLGDIETDGVILAHDLWVPIGGVDGVELAVDVDLLQLVNQDHCRIAVV